MALVFVNRYFHPDHSATAQMLADLAFHAARSGREVTVITGRQRLEHPRARLPAFERLHGLEVRRVWSTRFGRGAFAGRASDYLSFHASAFLALLAALRPGDTVVAATDPPLLGVTAGWAARLRGAGLVNWLHDVFPEVAQALGVRPVGGCIARVLQWLRDASVRDARANVTLGRLMARRILARGVPRSRIEIIHNWSDGSAITPLAHADNPLRRSWDLEDRTVVAYSGNLGRAHDLGALPEVAERVRDLDDLLFLVIGGGAGSAALRAQVSRRFLRNVRFLGYQPRALLPFSLAAADVHLTSLRPALEGLVVPSKLYGAMAAGRPCIHLGDAAGEVGQILVASGAGVAVPAHDAAGLEAAVRALHADPAQRARMGRRARAAFEERFDRPLALARWMALLGPPPPCPRSQVGSTLLHRGPPRV